MTIMLVRVTLWFICISPKQKYWIYCAILGREDRGGWIYLPKLRLGLPELFCFNAIHFVQDDDGRRFKDDGGKKSFWINRE